MRSKIRKGQGKPTTSRKQHKFIGIRLQQTILKGGRVVWEGNLPNGRFQVWNVLHAFLVELGTHGLPSLVYFLGVICGLWALHDLN